MNWIENLWSRESFSDCSLAVLRLFYVFFAYHKTLFKVDHCQWKYGLDRKTTEFSDDIVFINQTRELPENLHSIFLTFLIIFARAISVFYPACWRYPVLA